MADDDLVGGRAREASEAGPLPLSRQVPGGVSAAAFREGFGEELPRTLARIMYRVMER
jgi:hypothetical protein